MEIQVGEGAPQLAQVTAVTECGLLLLQLSGLGHLRLLVAVRVVAAVAVVGAGAKVLVARRAVRLGAAVAWKKGKCVIKAKMLLLPVSLALAVLQQIAFCKA